MKKYKVVVSNTVVVPVSGSLADESGKPVPFKFSLVCTRLDVDDFKKRFEGEGNLKDLMLEVTTGWSGQRLVLEENGEPAEFCTDAMDALLSISGMALVCFNAYSKEAAAKAKN